MTKKIDRAEFRKLAAGGAARATNICLRLASPAIGDQSFAEQAVGARVLSFVFSDNSVDRYGDTIDARGWQLDKFMQNPVALFGHDSSSVENVVGKARNVRIEGSRLIGEIEFMEASVNPAAESVFQMVKGGFLNAVSVGFAPLEWAMAKDKSRPHGVDFKKQELLEISIVPIPANPAALVQARAAGIDVDRLALQEAALPIQVKSLWHVAWLADILMDLDILEDCVSWEAAIEEDGSVIAERLKSELAALGQILIDMTLEEVGELLAEGDDEAGEPVDGVVEMSARASRMAILKSLVKADAGLVGAVRNALAPKSRAGLVELIAGITAAKAGKVLSSDNEKKLREAVDLHMQGCGLMNDVLGTAAPAPAPEADKALEDQARRARRALALKRADEAAA